MGAVIRGCLRFAFLWMATAAAADYVRPELVVDADNLIRLLAETPAELFDVRRGPIDAPSRVAGATRVDVGEWKNAFARGEGADAWSARIGAIVRDAEATVVICDNGVTPNAARAWWLLKYWGVKDVRLLNAGPRELAEIAPRLSSLRRPPASPGEPFVAVAQPSRLATYNQVLAAIGADSTGCCLVDTRTDREVASGVIPTAKHADWVRFIDPETGKLRSAAELRVILEETGFDPESPAISYCQSGGRAALVAFVMELMGGERVANYVGSWGEWSGRGPVAKLGQ